MGDEGKLYVNGDVVPAYKSLLRDADLILPNQFEAELLSEMPITSFATLGSAIAALHRTHGVPHVVVTSLRFPGGAAGSEERTLSVVGSTRRADGAPRAFRIDVPDLEGHFVGTGDMFAALAVVRLREAARAAGVAAAPAWVSPDAVPARELPLAAALEKVLASMHLVLEKTRAARDAELEGVWRTAAEEQGLSEQELHLRRTKASELRLVRNATDLKDPVVVYRAEAL